MPLALALVVVGAACSSRQNDVAFGQGGDGGTGGRVSQGGTAGGGTAAGSAHAGSASAGSATVGGTSVAGGATDGGMDTGGVGAGGTNGLAGSGESGASPIAGAGGAAGAGSSGCDEGCIQLCEGGSCMCSCPTTTLKCPNTVQDLQLSFSSACKVDTDCFAAEHYVGCCRVSVVGLSVVQRDSFTAWELDTCKSPPVCGCAVDVLTTDDGKMIRREMTYATRCTAGKCATSSP